MPAGFLEQIIEYRNYVGAKAVYDQHPAATSGLIDLVRIIDFELAQEEIDRGE